MLENFYSIINQIITDNSTVCDIRINSNHPIFDGHFPGMPVVPGACLMQIAQELVSMALKKNLVLCAAQNIKFMQVIYPDKVDSVTFELLWSESDGVYNTKCIIHDEEATYAMMKVTLCESVC